MVRLPYFYIALGSLALLEGAKARWIRSSIASAGCGKDHSFVGNSKDFTIESGGRNHTYRIHLPAAYDINNPQPLVFGYHGNGRTPKDSESDSQFSNDSINPHMIAVYPAGVHKSWQGPSYAAPGVDDEVFTTDLLNHLKQQYCIDTSRIYATGKSNGGGFVDTLACSPNHGANFAAFAIVSGAMYTNVSGNTNCTPSRLPLPMFEIHGTGDNTIPYDGGSGKGGNVPAIPEWLSRWVNRDNCSRKKITELSRNVQDIQWTCGGKDGMLRHLKMDGHSHKYPGEDDRQLFVSPVILSWLNQFSKR